MSSEKKGKLLTSSRVVDRILIRNNEEFTIPETASLVCRGAGLFNGGLQIGTNNSITPGSIRYDNDYLQILKKTGWSNVITSSETSASDNVITVLNSEGELQGSNISLTNASLSSDEDMYFTVNDSNNRIIFSNPSETISFLAPAPANATSPGVRGEIAWDENYLYVCVANNTWKRTALSSW